MSRFLTDADYDVLIRTEIRSILLENYTEQKLLSAEQMAIAQIRNYLAGRYNVNAIYTAQDNERNHFVVMITIDCTLYHLYSSLAPNKIPEHRSQRYADALEWLKLMAEGKTTADLPLLTDTTGEVKTDVRIASNYTKQNHKW